MGRPNPAPSSHRRGVQGSRKRPLFGHSQATPALAQGQRLMPGKVPGAHTCRLRTEQWGLQCTQTHTHTHCTHARPFSVLSIPVDLTADFQSESPSFLGEHRRACPRAGPGSLTAPMCLFLQSQNQSRSSVVGTREGPVRKAVLHGVSRGLGGAAHYWHLTGQATRALWCRASALASSGAVLAHEGHDAGGRPRLGQERVFQ